MRSGTVKDRKSGSEYCWKNFICKWRPRWSRCSIIVRNTNGKSASLFLLKQFEIGMMFENLMLVWLPRKINWYRAPKLKRVLKFWTSKIFPGNVKANDFDETWKQYYFYEGTLWLCRYLKQEGVTFTFQKGIFTIKLFSKSVRKIMRKDLITCRSGLIKLESPLINHCLVKYC